MKSAQQVFDFKCSSKNVPGRPGPAGGRGCCGKGALGSVRLPRGELTRNAGHRIGAIVRRGAEKHDDLAGRESRYAVSVGTALKGGDDPRSANPYAIRALVRVPGSWASHAPKVLGVDLPFEVFLCMSVYLEPVSVGASAFSKHSRSTRMVALERVHMGLPVGLAASILRALRNDDRPVGLCPCLVLISVGPSLPGNGRRTSASWRDRRGVCGWPFLTTPFGRCLA